MYPDDFVLFDKCCLCGNEYVFWIDYKLSTTGANKNTTTRIKPPFWLDSFFGSACCWELEDVVNISDMLLFMLFVYGTFIHRNAVPTVTYILPVCFLCWTTENTRLKPNFPPKRIFAFEKDWAVDIVEQTLKFAY